MSDRQQSDREYQPDTELMNPEALPPDGSVIRISHYPPDSGDTASGAAAALDERRETANGDERAAARNGHRAATRAKRRPLSPAQRAARRANALKSTGPRTVEGKIRVSQNARKWHTRRLHGDVEAKTLGQDPGTAEDLYRELISPYERSGHPAPPMLAMHFHDLARLRLELEAWEHIRDAQIDERWRQGQMDLRRRIYNMQRDLPVTVEEVFEKGLCGLPDSPAKTKHQAQCLHILQTQLEQRDYDILPFLEKLYGKDLNPNSDRAQTICIRCDRLLHPEKGPLSDQQFQGLLDLVAQEEEDAISAYGIYLDETSLPRSARVTNLRPRSRDRAMQLQGERLRQAIDRKQRLIIALLRALHLNRDDRDDEDDDGIARSTNREGSKCV